MGTGGVVLLSSASPTELVSIGKQGMLYVMQYSTSTSTQTMGGLDGCGYLSCPSWSNPQATDCSTASGPGNIVQCFAAVPFVQGLGGDNGLRGAPTFWPNANYIYMAGIGDAINSPLPLQAFSFNGSTFNTSPYTPDTQHTFNYPGGSTSLTWNSQQGTSTGVIWALDTS